MSYLIPLYPGGSRIYDFVPEGFARYGETNDMGSIDNDFCLGGEKGKGISLVMNHNQKPKDNLLLITTDLTEEYFGSHMNKLC